MRTGLGYSEAELQKAIPAVHYAVLRSPVVRDATTRFESSTAQIRTVVALELTASPGILNDLRAIATRSLIEETRPDITDSMTESAFGGVLTVGVILTGIVVVVVCLVTSLFILRRVRRTGASRSE